jgi:MoxR-like ATPase
MAEVLNSEQLTYAGTKQDPENPYLPSAELVDAINLAIYLERPLLIKGEPGCGKTRLARAVAYELNIPFEAWYVKSTSRAQDGLYIYDAVGRLRDAQLAAAGRLNDQQVALIDAPATYVRWGPLGRAFRSADRCVVLIDEIDKADIDFPNDLLVELDERRFLVEETGWEIHAKLPPIVFITSNDEKDLPDAFLRRCLFHHIDFPDETSLRRIVKSHVKEAPDDLITAAVARFKQLRDDMQNRGASKRVSTSELIDWVKVLRRPNVSDPIAKLKGELPFASVLLKDWSDYQTYAATTMVEPNK